MVEVFVLGVPKQCLERRATRTTFRSRLSESGSLDRVSQASVVDVEARRAGRHQRQVSGQMLKLKFGAVLERSGVDCEARQNLKVGRRWPESF